LFEAPIDHRSAPGGQGNGVEAGKMFVLPNVLSGVTLYFAK
jgi:hypothetical protein